MKILKVLAGVAGPAIAVGAWAWRRRRSRRQDAAGDESHTTELRDPLAEEPRRHGAKELSREARDALDRAIAKVVKKEFKRLCRKLPPDVTPGSRLGPATRALRAGKQPEYDEWEALYYMVRFFPRQVNLAYSILRAKYPEGITSPFRLVDVGCGPLAAQFAVAVLAAEGVAAPSGSGASKKPDVAVAGVDPSSAMRSLGRKVWCAWQREAGCARVAALSASMDALSESSGTFSSLPDLKRAKWLQVSLSITDVPEETDCWLTAFHAVYGGNLRSVTLTIEELCDLCEKWGCDPRIVFTTNETKQGLLDQMGDDWLGSVAKPRLCWKGGLERVTKRKRRLAQEAGVTSDAQNELQWEAKWNTLEGKDVMRKSS